MFLGFLKRPSAGQPVRVVASAQNLSRIANILEDIQGVGLRIAKPTSAEGLGWRIINDGTSDVDITDDMERARLRALVSSTCTYIGRPYWDASVLGAVVTVVRGALRHGNKTYLTGADSYTATITADSQYIGWRYDPASHALSVVGPFDDMPEDVEENGVAYAQGPLVQCSFDSGANSCRIKYMCHHGVVYWSGFDQDES